MVCAVYEADRPLRCSIEGCRVYLYELVSYRQSLPPCSFKAFKHGSVEVGEWYGLGSLLSEMGRVLLVRSKPAVNLVTTELPRADHWLYVSRFFGDSTGQNIIETVDCAK